MTTESVRAGYDAAAAQEKWQRFWEADGTFTPLDDDSRERRYMLDMFPYPSGDLHMGHAEAFVMGDIVARYWQLCGYDVMHPIGALAVGGVAGALFVVMFTLTQNRWRIDDVLGVWPLHGLCGAWGGIAAGIFGQKALGGAGGVAFMPQLLMTGLAIGIALVGSFIVYGLLKAAMGLRLDREEEFNGADLSIHRITATPEREPNW